MWLYECGCGVSAMSFDNSRLINDWNLSSKLCPCKEPSSPIPECLNTWKDYYEWRCIPLNSPAALLLHWPLTINWAVQLATRESLLPEISNALRIHYLGPEKELLQLAAFGELQALFPGVQVHIDLVGPAIPYLRNGERIDLNTYAQCNETSCRCKDPVENQKGTISTRHSRPITFRLHAGCYPPPLDAHLVISVMSMWTRMQPAYAANMWNEALNMRLGTEDLDLHGILAETERRGITFDQLLTVPEQDEWVYSDGKSTTCVAFILSMYKAAGVFGPVTNSIQVTEFTIRDAYMLKIYENNMTRLPNWCNNGDDKLPFCQILGE